MLSPPPQRFPLPGSRRRPEAILRENAIGRQPRSQPRSACFGAAAGSAEDGRWPRTAGPQAGAERNEGDGAGGGLLRAGSFRIHDASHRGTITCLEFYGTAHLLSGAEDGLICIWSTKRWECLKSIKAHKGHVTSLSIHPSGKLALSVGTDKTLRTWNLVEGRSAFIKNLKQNAHIIKWSPDGERYVTVITNKVDVYKLDTASITGTITTEKRISSLRFITNSIIAIAGDDEIVRLYNCDSQKCLCEFKAHENRIKDIYSFEREGKHIIVTASSDGYIKMWNLDLNKIEDGPSLLCEVNTKARLTCLAVWLDPASEVKENSDRDVTSSSQANEDEISLIVGKNKVSWADKSDKTAKRKITPEKPKPEVPLQKKKKKRNSSP
ncbi:p21-activated protein kinase-interacting protein 1 isoform X1 [Melanerpes formicivorus]|uniref:p21-activated protein kinase-interacting protein 1 isoform X1 n=1 Tax=Melanerpes formicivorus TaxID=211600 RepID=UPI00358DE1C4